MRKDRLVGEGRNYAVAVFAGNVSRGEDSFYPGMRGDEGLQISEMKRSAVKRRANHPQAETVGRDFVGAKLLRALDFAQAIEAY